MTRYLATVAMMLTAFPTYAQTYKCKDPGGTTVFQQTPCAEIGDLHENTEQTHQSIEPQCATLIASETEYFRCAAEVSCDRSGSVGTTRSQCIERKRQEMQRDASSQRVLAAERKAADEREKQRKQEELARAAAEKVIDKAGADKP
jgi:Domain of unknown function (DUF4124)